MKNQLFFLLPAALFCSLGAFCQPVLDASVEPSIGLTMKYVGSTLPSAPDVGGAGADQQWELPDNPLPFANLIRPCVASAGTPFAAQYLGATYCVKTEISGSPTRFAYYSQTDSSVRLHGVAFLGNIVYKNNPFWEQVYPMQYGDIQADAFTGTLKIGTQTTYFRTQFQRHYDGYGTLRLGPDGNDYQNAMRIKTLLTRTDSLPTANGSHTRTVVNEESYHWFLPQVPGYLAQVVVVNSVQMKIAANGDTLQKTEYPTEHSMEWQDDVTVPTHEVSSQNTQNLFRIAGQTPTELLLSLHHPAAQPTQVSVFGANGALRLRQTVPANDSEAALSIGQMPSGWYALSVRTAEGVQTIPWIKP